MEQTTLHGVNQQVSLEMMGWLCGILDGEGFIGLRGTGKRPYGSQMAIIQMVNTNNLIVEKYISLLKTLGVAFHIRELEQKYPRRKQWQISTLGFKRCIKFLPLIIPYLVGKKEAAGMLLELINSRLNLNSSSVGNSKRQWSDYENSLADKIKFSHRKSIFPKTSTTIC